MIKKTRLFLIFIFAQATAIGQTVDTSTAGVLSITPVNRYINNPVFVPFCDDVVWLGMLTLQLSTQQFLPEDSSTSCIPEKARRTYLGTSPKYQRFMRWEADPYDDHYYWAYEYQRDTLFFWRYDLGASRLDSFISLAWGRGLDHQIGNAGIWVVNDQELVLQDRHTGAMLLRTGKPIEGQLLQVRPWGEDVLVNDRWLYRRTENRYEDFFPLPENLKGCQTATGKVFLGETCISSTVGGSDEGTKYIISAGNKPFRLPFQQQWNEREYNLAVNPPYAWFYFSDKLIAFNYTTGDSIVYRGNNLGKPLIGDYFGRFLAFKSEKGLSFFDKNSREFRVLNLPYGFEAPHSFSSDQRYIYVTYDHHWEIIDFSRMELAFRRSAILEEFEVFDLKRRAMEENLANDFYAQYEAYSSLLQEFEPINNPKIEAEWPRISNQLRDLLYQAPDSVQERASKEYYSGRFSPKLSCGIVQAIYGYWCRKTALKQALQLLEIGDNEACIAEHDGYGTYMTQLLQSTQQRLDSVALLKRLPDERLYATGKVWWDYCTAQWGFGYLWNVEEGLKKPMACFRELIQKYPQSRWADNAVYDTLYFIDYQQQSTDDYMPVGNDNKAYQIFTQFLQDYPTSDRRPDVLVRLANVIQRGVYDSSYNTISKELADDYLFTVATEYPDFAKNSKAYQESLARQNQYQWSNRWNITLAFNQEKYSLGDSIFVTVQLQNRSGSAKTLDGVFLQDWHKGLKLQLSKVVETGCEGLWGDFPLFSIETQDSIRGRRIEPREYYSQTFILGHKSITKRFYPGSFELERAASYDFHLEFRHEQFSWLWVEAKNRGRIWVE